MESYSDEEHEAYWGTDDLTYDELELDDIKEFENE